MSLTRPKLQLDEKSFQGLLAAAFTIQEHADLLKQVRGATPGATKEASSGATPAATKQANAEANSSAGPEVTSKIASEPKAEVFRVCRQCGAPLKEGDSRCDKCALEEFRPGERMQRKFASLWEMSQERRVRQERPPGSSKGSVLELASSGLGTLPKDFNQSPESVSHGPEAPQNQAQVEDSVHSIPLAISDNDSVTELPEPSARSGDSLSDLRQLLNLHRADLYLGIAIVLAVVALLWPAAVAPQKPRLDPWQRVLVKLGVAEAPAAQVHYRGDPNAQVWIDPHSALYYCAGEDQYGKTADGRVTTQRDAQTDHFEPAKRAACN